MLRSHRSPSEPSASRRGRRLAAGLVALAVVALGLSACIDVPGDTSHIALVSTTTKDGWRYDFYRNTAYPCSISGYQTFVIGTRLGSAPTDRRPLWVRMRGGGAGWFGSDGKPEPGNGGVMVEQSFAELMKFDDAGLTAKVKAAPQQFRELIVSMCSQDVYGGMNTHDPNNPHTVAGKPRPTTGLVSTKAAVQFALAKYHTPDYFLDGTSAGGAGTFHVAWGLQLQGMPPAGLISDSGNIDQQWEHDVVAQGLNGSAGCDKATDARGNGVIGRVDPTVADPANQPDLLIARGALTVPVLHVWNHGDSNVCGDAPMTCTLRDGSHVHLTAADCHHENLRRAIAAQGPTSRSMNMGVCVEGGDTTQPCDRHVVTGGAGLVNTDHSQGVPADFETAILQWVVARIDDDTP